ncbi:MAG: bifunctional oligoribonuclease/PAP phosphatase NrnA [Prolixibacteraceae bacterium]|nr:bifunctional oligoribonuclease/PAP phosphatase NrnA [Prolixibacteraceae bacterium]MBN2772820.1 bifunctional oligoribonuclease/PAP phosphatase NrnA [Prolixibacteraceae bacterium]
MKTVDKELFKDVGSLIESVDKVIAIIPHHNPDGDAIGAAVGLANILFNRGNKVTIIFPNDFPAFYNWIEIKAEVLFYNSNKKTSKKAIEHCDILFCVDFNDSSRAGQLEKTILEFNGPKILIDHHPEPGSFCNYIISDISYSSTAEMIFDFITVTGLVKFMDKTVAESLYTGIMTDTGSFSHNISDPNTFRVISALLKFGINADEIHGKVYHNYSTDRMRLLGYCLNEKMEVFTEYHSAIISITQEELKRFNFMPGDTEGFVNYPLSISGIVFSVLFIEKEDHVKLSFRSKGTFPANKFASTHFNGGGHLNAAGGEDNQSLEKSVQKFRQLLPVYLHQLINASEELK